MSSVFRRVNIQAAVTLSGHDIGFFCCPLFSFLYSAFAGKDCETHQSVWRWRRNVPLKCWLHRTLLDNIRTQETVIHSQWRVWSSCVCCVFQSHEKGKHLLEQVCRQLNLVEKDYFGLRYVDHTRQRVWLRNLVCHPENSLIRELEKTFMRHVNILAWEEWMMVKEVHGFRHHSLFF
jgi:hypothetical protein